MDPPCGRCNLPELWPENAAVWEVYRLVAGAEGVALDILGLLDRLGVQQPLQFLRKLLAVIRVARENVQRWRENAGS